MKSSANRLLALAVILVFLVAASHTFRSHASSQARQSWRNKVSPDLLERLDRGESADVDVIIQSARRVNAGHREFIKGCGAEVTNEHRLIQGLSARLPLKNLEQLSNHEDFLFVSPNRRVHLFGHLETTTGAASARSLMPGISNLNGAGVGIAILDSGISHSHHELSYSGVSRLSVDVDAGGFGNADDYAGHGTHVASVACGTNHIGPGNYTGIAPGAKIINVKVLNHDGEGYTSNIINAINWCVVNRAAYNIKVINMSLGAPAIDSYVNDPLCKAVRAAHDAGIVVVAAAGNDGKDANGNKLYGAIHSPGIEPSAITVGAANTLGTDGRADDVVTTFSSRGPTRGYYTDAYGTKHFDNLIKPDLIAPGNKIIAAEGYNCELIVQHPELDANVYETNANHYVMYMSGTSVSAPVVAGAAALLLQANPSLTPNVVKAILMYSAQPLAGFNTLEQGAGLLNIDGAVRLARIIKNPVSGLANGQGMLTAALPTQQSTISGQTFLWGRGVVTNWSFVYGNDLMTYWQGMYGQGVLLADGTYCSGALLLRNLSLVSSGVLVSDGALLSDGTILSSGALILNGQGTLLGDGALLSDGTLLGDASVTSDSALLSDGVLISDSVAAAALSGDGVVCMQPNPDGTGQ